MSKRTYKYIFLALLLGALPACNYKDDPNYCPGRPLNNCLNDGPTSCTSDQDCSGDTAVCDVSGTMTCVQCTTEQDAACVGATPVCGSDNTCRSCAAHAECAGSDACLPDGSCADPSQVAYVKPLVLGGTDNQSCTFAMPCTKVASALQTGLPYVKLAGTNDEGNTISLDNRDVTLLAESDAKLVRTSNGLHVEVKGTSLVEIYDLEISGASGAQGVGISLPTGNTARLTLQRVKLFNNDGGGISASGGTLTVSQSTISGNTGGGIAASSGTLIVYRSTISGNLGGGISVSGAGVTFNITNSFIVRNGDELAGTFGGLSLGIAVSGNNRLEFNTIVDNKAAVNSAGVVCNVPAFMAPNNIVARNNLAGSTTSPNAQITMGGCTYPSSKIQGDVAGLMFEHPDPPGTLSYKLLPGSTAIDQATTPSDIVVDHEGQPRPSGNGKDIGADELQQ